MITIIRGVSGSGKSTMANSMVSRGDADAVIEADMWFEGREFDARDLKKAHAWCFESARRIHRAGYHVVVSNTFTQVWEMEPYLSECPEAKIITAAGMYENIHGVPEWKVDAMRKRWEQYP